MERHARKQLAARGERLVKLRRNAPEFSQYGPYLITDTSTSMVVQRSLDLEQVAEYAKTPAPG